MTNILIIIAFILLIYVLYICKYNKYKEQSESLIKEVQIEKEINIEEIKEKPIQEQKYKLNTHKVKYLLYDCKNLSYTLSRLYQDIVYKNFWINENFHSIFYRILMILNKNEFMIIDSNSRVLTLNMRNEKNEMCISKSYQVFDTIDIFNITIKECIDYILEFKKNDAQNIVIAICIIILENSVHYLSNEESQKLINSLLNNYEFINDINIILDLVKKDDDRLKFIKVAINKAYKLVYTKPYNDSEVQAKPLLLAQKLPKKFLQEI